MNKRRLTKTARKLRRNQTPSEVKMWTLLRNKRLSGYKFYRQYPIGPYITDFCSRGKRLVVEIDGGGHDYPEQIIKDNERDQYLRLRDLECYIFGPMK